MLTVDDLGKRYGPRWLFRNLIFSLSVGDRLVILGRNGSGKSTLLRTLAGLLPPSEGKVTYEGDPRLTMGLSALEMALYPSLTVAEHLVLSANLRGCEPRTDELLAMIGLEHARDLYAHKLSTGMKARLKLAMAIQSKPSALLLDEPGASLDESGRKLVEAIIDEQTKRGCLVVATNEPAERRFATYELELAS